MKSTGRSISTSGGHTMLEAVKDYVDWRRRSLMIVIASHVGYLLILLGFQHLLYRASMLRLVCASFQRTFCGLFWINELPILTAFSPRSYHRHATVLSSDFFWAFRHISLRYLFRSDRRNTVKVIKYNKTG